MARSAFVSKLLRRDAHGVRWYFPANIVGGHRAQVQPGGQTAAAAAAVAQKQKSTSSSSSVRAEQKEEVERRLERLFRSLKTHTRSRQHNNTGQHQINASFLHCCSYCIVSVCFFFMLVAAQAGSPHSSDVH